MCETVGRTLPEIIMGNSETGHLRIGQNTAYHGALARCWALGQVLDSHVEASIMAMIEVAALHAMI